MAINTTSSVATTQTLSNGATMTILPAAPVSTRRSASDIAEAVAMAQFVIANLAVDDAVVKPADVLSAEVCVNAGVTRTDIAKAAANLMNDNIIRQHNGFKHARWIAFDATVDATAETEVATAKSVRGRRDKATVENARQTVRSTILAMLNGDKSVVQRKDIMLDPGCIAAGVKDTDLAFVVDAMKDEGAIVQDPEFQRGRWTLPASV